MEHGDTRRLAEESSPEGSPMRHVMAPQMYHNDEESVYARQNMDDKCRHDLQPRASHNHQQSQSSFNRRSVRFDGTSMDSQNSNQ